MGEPRGGFGLAVEPFAVFKRLRSLQGGGEDGLDRDDAVHQRVLGLVHGAHRAAPDLFQDFVSAKPRHRSCRVLYHTETPRYAAGCADRNEKVKDRTARPGQIALDINRIEAKLTSATLSRHDLEEPGLALWARPLRRLALRLGFEGTPFAVNGILRRRFTVRRHKLWEYARGAAGAFSCEGGAPRRVLAFGGGATLPIFFFASRGVEVLCLDVDGTLVDWTNQVAAKRKWPLRATTYDLVESAPRQTGRR